jgi:Domain of unknown function (DUF4287)
MNPAARARRVKDRADKPARHEPRTSGEAVRRATGRDRDEWFALLDAWGAAGRKHGEIAAWIMREHGIANWWAQTLTVDYEYARGMRQPGGNRDGTFAAGATKTIAVPVKRLFESFVDARVRKRWLSGHVMRERTAQPGRSARFDWNDGATRLIVGFTAKGKAKSQIALQHERLPTAHAAKKAQTYWRERLTALKTLLEG